MNSIRRWYFAEGDGGADGTGNVDASAQATTQGAKSGATSPDVKPEAGAAGPQHEETIPYARLQEVIQQKNALQAQIDQYNAAKKAAEEDAAKKKGDWEKLATQREQDLSLAKARLREMALRNATTVAAVAANAVDPDAVFALLDKSKVQVKDDGTVDGVKEAVGDLLKAKPYLIKQAGTPGGYNPGAGSTGDGGALTPEEIGNLTPDQYKEYRVKHPEMLSRR